MDMKLWSITVLPIASASGVPPQRVPVEHIELPYLTATTKSTTAIKKMNTDAQKTRNLGCTLLLLLPAMVCIISYRKRPCNEKLQTLFDISVNRRQNPLLLPQKGIFGFSCYEMRMPKIV